MLAANGSVVQCRRERPDRHGLRFTAPRPYDSRCRATKRDATSSPPDEAWQTSHVSSRAEWQHDAAITVVDTVEKMILEQPENQGTSSHEGGGCDALGARHRKKSTLGTERRPVSLVIQLTTTHGGPDHAYSFSCSSIISLSKKT